MHFLRRVSELFRSVHSERPRRAVFALRCRTRRSVEVDVVLVVVVLLKYLIRLDLALALSRAHRRLKDCLTVA